MDNQALTDTDMSCAIHCLLRYPLSRLSCRFWQPEDAAHIGLRDLIRFRDFDDRAIPDSAAVSTATLGASASSKPSTQPRRL
jgi:hypothetical protein